LVYSIGEFSKLTGISIDTLRYYEKEKLIHPARNKSNQRQFTEKDKTWIDFILRLKETAMPIREIKEYARLRDEGDATLKERMEMLRAHRRSMLEQMEKLENNLGHLDKKIDTYEATIAALKQ
jgi:DNA-binding transcriptional MerR regulator